MENKPLTLEEIHEGTLVILKKIIEICDKINVNYFIAYGTLIGAVRHKGFIPWDDDLDIIMLRPEYDKFVSYCDAHENELYPFRLMNRFNTPGYPFNISRFNDLRYRMETNGYPDAGMGMFVDIYPFDGCGNDRDEAIREFNPKKKFLMRMLSLTYSDSFTPSKKSLFNTLAKLILYPIAKILGMNYFLCKLDNLCKTYDYSKSKFVGVVTWDEKCFPVEKAWVEKTIEAPFEGLKVKIPVDYDKVLRLSYGDYMKLPPVEERVPHHGYSLFKKTCEKKIYI